jgi:putative flippase GtrA
MADTSESSIDKLLKNQTDRTHIQFFRYIFVGSIAFIVQFSSLYALTSILGVYYLISAPIAFILGLIANYTLSIYWVFSKHKFNNMWSEFMIFSIIGVVGLGLNEAFMWFFTDFLGLFYLISNIFAAALILFWNFFARKLTLF